MAVKATKMESNNCQGGPSWRDEEIDEVLIKITENDDDFCNKNNVRSPDTTWNTGLSKNGTPSCSRRESVWSTFSLIKSKLWDKSNTSIENVPEEKFWEVLNKNKVSAKQSRDFTEQARCLNTGPIRQASIMSDQSTGNKSSSIRNSNREGTTEFQELDVVMMRQPQNTEDSCTNLSSSPSDRTSLLQPE